MGHTRKLLHGGTLAGQMREKRRGFAAAIGGGIFKA
jgi:hypothetical protein